MSWGGRLLLYDSIGSKGERHIVQGWAAAKVVSLAWRTALAASMHFVPIMDIGDGQRVFCFSGTNLCYTQLFAYDAQGCRPPICRSCQLPRQ